MREGRREIMVVRDRQTIAWKGKWKRKKIKGLRGR